MDGFWGVFGVLLLAGGALGAFVYFIASADNADVRHEKQALYQANHACVPGKTKDIERHGSGWSNGSYWKIRCKDGSVHVVLVP